MLSVKKRSWEFDFAANSNTYTGYIAIINSIAVLRYWGISGIKMGNRQGETRDAPVPVMTGHPVRLDPSPSEAPSPSEVPSRTGYLRRTG